MKTMLKKEIMLILIMSVLTFFQLRAQDDFSIGPRVGLNFSNVSNVDESKSLTGLALGLTSTYSINETSGLTVDLLYSKEGYKLNDDEFKVAYFQIPILFDVFFGELGSAFRPKVYAGVTPGFLLNAKQNDTELEKDNFNSVNFALTGGLGFNARMGSRIWLNTDLRAYLGLNDVRDKEFQIGDKVKNNNIQLSVGLAYGLSKLD
jgi:hypothetical protein